MLFHLLTHKNLPVLRKLIYKFYDNIQTNNNFELLGYDNNCKTFLLLVVKQVEPVVIVDAVCYHFKRGGSNRFVGYIFPTSSSAALTLSVEKIPVVM